MARGLTLAVWVFCLNVSFVVFQATNPFGIDLQFGFGSALMDMAMGTSKVTGISFLGIPEMVMAINLFFSLILGPLLLVPDIMNLIGITGIINTCLTACVWLIWGWFIFQIISGRMLKEVV